MSSELASAPVIQFEGVSKRYRLKAGQLTLREILASLATRGNGEGAGEFWALRDVSFAVAHGESMGIIGPNGAGKTTTLKMLSRITRPTTGRVAVAGRTSALIELGAGFHPELTGRENVYLNGIILGLSRQEVGRKFDEIVAFAEVEQFIDTPVKRYSSGMYARLGFAIAAHIEPQVLLVDEVLSVGDMAFQERCFSRMEYLRRNGTTMIFVSHNFAAVQRVCSRCLVLYKGQLAFDGRADEAIAEYSAILRRAASSATKTPSRGDSGGLAERQMTHAARIQRTVLCGPDGVTTAIRTGDHARVQMEAEFYEDAPAPIFACCIRSEAGEIVYNTTTRLLKTRVPDFKAGQRALITFDLDMHLLAGTYNITVDAAYADLSYYYDYVANAILFTVRDDFSATGFSNLGARVEVEVL